MRVAYWTALALLLLVNSAAAQTRIDLSPMTNLFVEIVASLILTMVLPLMFIFMGKLLKSWGVESEAEITAWRASIDAIAQKAIGRAVETLKVEPGRFSMDVRNEIIAEAANSLVQNAADSMKKLGVKDNELMVKAREVIEARVGMMTMAAAGTPIPNPSQPAPAMIAPPVIAPVPTLVDPDLETTTAPPTKRRT